MAPGVGNVEVYLFGQGHTGLGSGAHSWAGMGQVVAKREKEGHRG